MLQVYFALLPAIVFHIYTFGWGIFWQILLGISSAFIIEVLLLKILKKPMELGLLFNLDPSMIIDYMNSLLSSVFNISENSELKEWGNSVISDMAEKTEQQVKGNLGQ